MDNKAFQADQQQSDYGLEPPSYDQSTGTTTTRQRQQQRQQQHTQHDESGPPPPPSSASFSLVREEMEALRATLDPGVFNAVLDHGEMPTSDVVKLIFLIAFPTVFFILTIVLMAEDA